MSVHERVLASFEKHGPMTTGQLRKHVDVAWVAVACAKAARDGALVRLGGGAHSSIYGLPGQKLPKGETAAAASAPAKPRKAGKAAAGKRSAPVRKVQRKTARKAQKTVSRPPARPAGSRLRMENAALRAPCADAASFRTAIASDGAMIFLGAAAGPFELTRPESRALIEFVRTLDGAKLAA
jgi:hypothetical protein